MDKLNLDYIIKRHKAQPVGHGYIDIIVSRDTYKDFITDIVRNDYKLTELAGGNGVQTIKSVNMDLADLRAFFTKVGFLKFQ